MPKGKTIILFAVSAFALLVSSCEHCIECAHPGPTLPQDAQEFCFDNTSDMNDFKNNYEAVGYECHEK